MEKNNNRGTMFRLAMLWLAIILLGSFWVTVREISDPVSMAVISLASKEGEPVLATFKVNNPSSHGMVIRYQFYANGELVNEGVTTVAPELSKTYKYAYENPLQLGEQLNFVVRTQSEQGDYEKILSSPPYPPQVWSSFVSFASFSTSVMSSISTMTYYQSIFGSDMEPNVGIIISIVLVTLLVLAELARPVLEGRSTVALRRLKIRFSTVIWILFIIFMGIIYTEVAMMLVS